MVACHTFIKDRDCVSKDPYVGRCITCGCITTGSNFQAGHWEASATCGAILRYHPNNIHGQCGFKCNINRHGQQKIAVEYTMKMVDKYGIKRVRELRELKNKSIKASKQFYMDLESMYNKGYSKENEKKIIKYLETKCTQI